MLLLFNYWWPRGDLITHRCDHYHASWFSTCGRLLMPPNSVCVCSQDAWRLLHCCLLVIWHFLGPRLQRPAPTHRLPRRDDSRQAPQWHLEAGNGASRRYSVVFRLQLSVVPSGTMSGTGSKKTQRVTLAWIAPPVPHQYLKSKEV